MNTITFPDDFIWGTAASAYQTEGNIFNNDWFEMERLDAMNPPEKRRFREPCGAACDHWNRYEEDYDLAARLGITMHRLSIEWSRVYPEMHRADLVTDMGWIFYPQGIYEILRYLGAAVNVPIIVTENGVATTDESFRMRYMEAHIRQVHRAMAEGIPVKGYMCWSLTDNFEWDKGYAMRFGLIHVDFSTQKRTIKEGGDWYSGVIRNRGF